jgi:hypothetical protein
MWPAGSGHRKGRSPCGEEPASKSGEVASESDIMTAGVSVPKPDQIFATLQDRIEARNAVNAVAWPDYVHTGSARQARLRTRARGKQRRWRRDQFGPTSPADRGRVTSSRGCSWKAIFPPRSRSATTSSTPSFACSATRLTTSSRAPDINENGGRMPARAKRRTRHTTHIAFSSMEILP